MTTTKSQLTVLEELARREQHQAFVHREDLRAAAGLGSPEFDAALGLLRDRHLADTIGPWVTILVWGRDVVRTERL